MTDKMFMGSQQRNIAAAAAFGMNALRPIMHYQVMMLRMWADSIETFASNSARSLEETASTLEEQSEKRRAA